ncbi:ChrB protein [Sphingobium lactosutens]|uniref:chromate resistance protein ChrB domain-containing protein n=1 Tax=Sphingobium lactosutens TaxID=522773 RepID=UPI0015BBFF1A|nr:chromate resistance protein ChrB domain-containing protein [Sphingobium lactosutens]NWK96386.1 ChrB protein [Sphingobium lactosutens]
MNVSDTGPWLALLHQLPAKPPYLRVKIWRRLQAIGAVPLKNAVHVLPHSSSSQSAFRDLLEEITSNGGEAILIEARLLAGQSDNDVRALFDTARDADYEEIVQTARRLLETGPASGPDIVKLQRRFEEVGKLDFFGAHGRQEAEAALAELDRQRYRHPDVSRNDPSDVSEPIDFTKRTWVTRSGVHVDRIACAWLIRRFIDPDAIFKFADSRHYEPMLGELRFDMVDAEFTHEEDRCSFETLLLHANLIDDPALVAIGEIIHELDIGDGKFARPETAGIGAMLSGVCASTDDDLQRIAMATATFDQFHAFFSNRKTDR